MTTKQLDTELKEMAAKELAMIEKAGAEFAEHVSRILIDSEKSRKERHEIILEEYEKTIHKAKA